MNEIQTGSQTAKLTNNNSSFFEALFNSNTHGIAFCDGLANIISVNTSFLQIFNCEEENIIGQNIIQLINKASSETEGSNFFGTNETRSREVNIKQGPGENKKKVVKLKREFITTQQEKGFIVYADDISDIALKEQQWGIYNTRLKNIYKRIKKILDSSADMICAIDQKGNFIKVSAACKSILGYEPTELTGKNFQDLMLEDEIEQTKVIAKEVQSGNIKTNFDNRYIRKDGTIAELTWSSHWDPTDKIFYSIARDAGQKKLAELALRDSEEKYKILFNDHPIPSWILDPDTLQFLEVNEAAIKHYGYSREEFLNLTIADILIPEEFERYCQLIHQGVYNSSTSKGIWKHKRKNNEIFDAEISSGIIKYLNKKASIVLAIDKSEQAIAQQELIKSNEKYLFLTEATFDAIWDWDLLTNKIIWNESAKKMFNIQDSKELDKENWWEEHIHSDDRDRVVSRLLTHIKDKITNWEDEYRFLTQNNQYKYIYDRGFLMYDSNGNAVRMIGAMQDLTQRKSHETILQELNTSLEKRAKELASSNEELERFAYVASHDLQEPLRMVTSFLQLLEKRYKDKLDDKAKQYIAYAVDGSERMKKLILDLLEYSRVNTSGLESEEVNTAEILKEIILTYKTQLKLTGGKIIYKDLPTVSGNKTQLLQLFQNLIGNALKYKSDLPPVITVNYEAEPNFHKFIIADNGIGIDPKFFKKIFVIFQRLHNRDQYSGTGIGLAICKKIIEKHNGKIWVTSIPGEGSTFYFTIPKS